MNAARDAAWRAYWDAAVKRGEAGFTAAEIEADVKAFSGGGFARWIKRRLASGAIEPMARTHAEPRWRVTRASALDLKRQRDQHIWTAMRTLGSFTIDELRAAASTDDLDLKRSAVADFVRLLRDAGALMIMAGSARSRGAVLRLRPSLNTGPKAPKLSGGRLVDGNNGAPLERQERAA